jgi:hypothetical protein
VWHSLLLAASEADPGTTIGIGGGILGGGGLAVLFYLLRESNLERREMQRSFDQERLRNDDFVRTFLPVLTALSNTMDRVIAALSQQIDYHEQPKAPAELSHAIEQLRQMMDDLDPDDPRSRRRKG